VNLLFLSKNTCSCLGGRLGGVRWTRGERELRRKLNLFFVRVKMHHFKHWQEISMAIQMALQTAWAI